MTKNKIILKIAGRGFDIYQSWHLEFRELIFTLKAYEGSRKGQIFTIEHRLSMLDIVSSKYSEHTMDEIENQVFETLFEKMKEEGVL